MECTTHKDEILNTFSRVSHFSYIEKKTSISEEKRMNDFLDAILDIKSDFSKKTENIDNIVERVEGISWFDDLDEECLILLSDLVSVLKDLTNALFRQYASTSELRKKGIAKVELKNFKNALDDLKEVSQDLESTYFNLPKIHNFVETTKKLSLV